MRRRHALIPLLAAAGGLAVTACGDPVSANRDFRALATTTITRVVDAAGLPHTHAVYAGPLVDGSGRAIRGTWFREVCDSADASGDLVADAVLAAVAMEHAATVATLDRDFARFTAIEQLRPA